MTWTLARGLVYLACLAASGLALAGLAGAAGGVVSSTLAAIALWRGWGRR